MVPGAHMSSQAQSILLASSNAHKLAELRGLCAGLPLRALSPTEAGFTLPAVIEDGESFHANARLKALSGARAAHTAGAPGLWVLADDSGLEVEALGGAPGVRSARYALDTDEEWSPPRHALDRRNLARLLTEMAGQPESRRRARFVCVLAVARGGEIVFTVEGEVEGRILEAPRGEGGFGYDPIFFHPPSGVSFAQLSPANKAAVSHRGQAMRRLRAKLQARLGS